MTITNLFGDLATELSIKSLIQKFARFRFSSSSDLYVNVTSLPTLTTVTTITTANNGISDWGKNATGQATSQANFQLGIRRNFSK